MEADLKNVGVVDLAKIAHLQKAPAGETTSHVNRQGDPKLCPLLALWASVAVTISKNELAVSQLPAIVFQDAAENAGGRPPARESGVDQDRVR